VWQFQKLISSVTNFSKKVAISRDGKRARRILVCREIIFLRHLIFVPQTHINLFFWLGSFKGTQKRFIIFSKIGFSTQAAVKILVG
jgi:hypothetical protein